jgi:hypothetical protein
MHDIISEEQQFEDAFSAMIETIRTAAMIEGWTVETIKIFQKGGEAAVKAQEEARAIMAPKSSEFAEATHKISAVYFPGSGEVELTWEDIETGEVAALTVGVSPEQGETIARVVVPCGYSDAIMTDMVTKDVAPD